MDRPTDTATDQPTTPAAGVVGGPCRSCGAVDLHTVVDLGLSPLCETFIPPAAAHRGEMFHPLECVVCHTCWLVQVGDVVDAATIFDDQYPYFASYSTSWLAHAEAYVSAMVERLDLDGDSRVVEVGSNDGYLLQYVVQRGIPALGVDPTANTAEAAREKGVETRVDFFGRGVASALVDEGWQADLVCGANVMAQVPDLNDFVAGLATLVKPDGMITIEWPHALEMFLHSEFDTIYHEHWSYFSVLSTIPLLERHGLRLVDVETLGTHGGSLRIFAQPAAGDPATSATVAEVLAREREAGMDTPVFYDAFAAATATVRDDLLRFLIDARAEGRQVVGYGAPGKGNTLLNHAGIKPDLLRYLVDRNPVKHGRLTPGSRIPIHPTEHLAETRPDVILIMPWNLRSEIAAQLAYTQEWGAQLMVAIPQLSVVSPDGSVTPV